MRGLKDKVGIVAGGGRGIGAATARRLAEEGAHVVIGDLIFSAAGFFDPAKLSHVADREFTEKV